MPHGVQWSYDDIRNAERAAEIQARAFAKVQREERERAEREARRNPAPTRPVEEPRMSTQSQAPLSAYEQERINKWAEQRVEDKLAKMRAEQAVAASYGTVEYIRNRYGFQVWRGKITEYKNRYNCTDEEAATLIVRNYKEEEWKHLENPLIEKYMGHRP